MNSKDMYAPCPCGSGKKFKFCCYQKQREQTRIVEVVAGSGKDGKRKRALYRQGRLALSILN